jgi:hypothetical protein
LSSAAGHDAICIKPQVLYKRLYRAKNKTKNFNKPFAKGLHIHYTFRGIHKQQNRRKILKKLHASEIDTFKRKKPRR